MSLECMILFRQIKGSVRPSNWYDGAHWYVECHDTKHDMPFPLGTAYVLIAPAIKIIEFILVPDQHRRKGVATKLVEACQNKWPELTLTDSISESGEGFLDSLCATEARR